MEDQAKLLADLTAAVSSMKAKLDEMHTAVLDLHTWKPMIEQSVESLRAEAGDLRGCVIDTNKSAAAPPTSGVPPPLRHLSADAPSTSLMPAKPAASLLGVHATAVLELDKQTPTKFSRTGFGIEAVDDEAATTSVHLRTKCKAIPVPLDAAPVPRLLAFAAYILDSSAHTICSTKCCNIYASSFRGTEVPPLREDLILSATLSSVTTTQRPRVTMLHDIADINALGNIDGDEAGSPEAILDGEYGAHKVFGEAYVASVCLRWVPYMEVEDMSNRDELRPIPWPSFRCNRMGARLIQVVWCRHERPKHGKKIWSTQLLRPPWPPPETNFLVRHKRLAAALLENGCQLKRTWRAQGCSSFSSAREGSFWESKQLELTYLVSYMMEHYTDMSYGIKTGHRWVVEQVRDENLKDANGLRSLSADWQLLRAEELQGMQQVDGNCKQLGQDWYHTVQSARTHSSYQPSVIPIVQSTAQVSVERVRKCLIRTQCIFVGLSPWQNLDRGIPSRGGGNEILSLTVPIVGGTYAIPESSNHNHLTSSNASNMLVPRKVTGEPMSTVLPSGEPEEHSLDAIITVKWHGTNLLENNLVLLQYQAPMRDVYKMFAVTPMLQPGLFTRLADKVLLEVMLGRGELVCSPELGLFLPWQGHLRHLSSWILVDCAENIPKLIGRAATGRRYGRDLGHYSSALNMSKRPEQYRDSMNIDGNKLTHEGATLVTWLCAPWDPGGYILQAIDDGGLRASRMLRRGKCHGPCWAAIPGRMGRCEKGATGHGEREERGKRLY